MKVFIVSILLAAVYLVICSSHRQTPRTRTSFVTRTQFRGICNEISSLKEEINLLQQQNKEEINLLRQQNMKLQNKVEDQEQSIDEAGKYIIVQFP